MKRLLDLFCGAGGATMGYHRAGFEIVGVDIDPQPRYPFEFIRADAMTFPLDSFDVIHASPPCQAYSQLTKLNAARNRKLDYPDLIGELRKRLAGRHYVIENVPGAPLIKERTVFLCGSMFGLNIVRHRKFESNIDLSHKMHCRHSRHEIGVYGKLDGRRIYTRKDGTEIRVARTLEIAREAMGIGWMEWDELTQAVPPSYTYWIGRRLQDWI